VAKGTPGWEELRREFGPGYFQEDGSLDRARMAELVFQDAGARQKLNAIVHPRVSREIAGRLADLAARGVALVMVEVPLLFEAGLEKNFDAVIVVDAGEPEQIDRIAARDGRSAREAADIIEAQWPLAAKKDRADFVIDNRGSLSDTREHVKKLWQQLKMVEKSS
jgi:dephospho-CoA kinase